MVPLIFMVLEYHLVLEYGNKQGAVFGLRETGSVIGPPLMAISNFDMQ
jgi:hypothetical protein